jgi:hypothetical protein
MLKSIKFFLTTGVTKGYFHENENFDIEDITVIWQKLAQEKFDESGIYISALAFKSKAIYSEDWGCPKAGENTLTFTGSINPTFTKDVETWKKCVIEIATEIKKTLEQSTITVEFIECEINYLTE